MESDEAFLRRAMALAEEARRAGEVPVGAVLVIDGEVIEAWNVKETAPDPTAHAEMMAIREAARRLGRWRLTGGTLYVTKEPCVMCAGALVAARVDRVVFGCYDPKGGAAGSIMDLLRDPRLNHRMDVLGGVLEEEAAEQLRSFFAAQRRASEEN
ncbi:tRNA adenosine(34) deaminase TadA [bacterium]|nr:MAG: tRNA adenosine(34) deaminase TadA [bacterium]